MSRLLQTIIAGVLTGFTGMILSLTPLGVSSEVDIGLDVLFKLRGIRQAPSEVILVSVDNMSADMLNVPDKPDKWPRSLHADLTEILARSGARVIVFDIMFEEARPLDDSFAQAIKNAGNVVLVESLIRETAPIRGPEGAEVGGVNIETIVQPQPLLADSAVASAPFPLPKVPVKVSQYWTFKTTAGDTPTLPIVVFQLYALDSYEEFLESVTRHSRSGGHALPRSAKEIVDARSLVRFIKTVRSLFEHEPHLADKMIRDLDNAEATANDHKRTLILKSLIRLYQTPNTQYLNFYGPPQTIRKMPYYQVLAMNEIADSAIKPHDIRDKVVFIGASESNPTVQKDGFYTVYSRPDGLDISGTEIAATAFANLLEDKPVRPVPFASHLLIILVWGVTLGIICIRFSSLISMTIILGMGLIYFLTAYYQFTDTGSWYPLFVPLFVQIQMAFWGSLAWKYFETNRERKNIRKAFSYYLPDDVVEKISRNIAVVKTETVYGTCLSSDAEHYTSLSETMDPNELCNFINKYYEALFNPVKSHGGNVSNVIGDSMLAIWVSVKPESSSRRQACLSALEIDREVRRFNQSSASLQLPTRIGLHSGNIVLGNIGAVDHYEYRPVGDIVNTATRIEGLNKYLDTKILLSTEVMENLDGFLTREIGHFLFVGKSQPITIHELICLLDDASDADTSRCRIFSKALDAFRRQRWNDAVELFSEVIKTIGSDGPSRFYLKVCKENQEKPPGGGWDGVVRMDKK